MPLSPPNYYEPPDWQAKALATPAAAIAIQFGLQAAIGLLLWLVGGYQPSVDYAYESLSAMSVPMLWLQAAHFWGGAALIVQTGLHLTAMIWFGWYRRPHGFRYLASLVMLLCALGLQITGNLLSFDRHAVQTASIEASIASQVPFVGQQIAEILLGGSTVGQPTLDRWFAAHIGLVFLLILGSLGAVVTHFRMHDKTDWRLSLGFAFALTTATCLLPLPHGSAPTAADFGAYDAAPGWYVMPLHGLLVFFGRFGIPWVGSAVIPAVLIGVLITLPLWGRRAPMVAIQGGLIAVFLALLVATLGSGASPAPLFGSRDPKTLAPDPPLLSTQQEAQDLVLSNAGRKLFAEHGCNNCHGEDGMEARFGPSLAETHLTHPGPRYYIDLIRNPRSIEANSTMPAFPDLTDEELRALAEFLRFPRRATELRGLDSQ